jgi:hypothetical protein
MQSRAAHRSTGIRLRSVLALALLAVVAACSMLRVGYNNADTLLIYTLDDYFDLDTPQEDLVKERARALLAWHRATQLRGYADLLEEAGRRVEAQVSADEVLALNLEFNRRLVAIGDRAALDLGTIALTLQPAQLDRFAVRLTQDNKKVRREVAAAGGEHALERRAKKSAERAREWFGYVSPKQEELIRSALDARADGEEWWVLERERRRAEILGLLRRAQAERPAPEELAGWLREYFARLSDPEEPERRARLAEYRRGNAELIAALVNAASPQQRANLLDKLRGYAEDLAVLASAGQRS